MNKLYILFCYLSIPIITLAQGNVGIGTSTPNASAKLDINTSTDPANAKKGILIPNVSLTATNSPAPVASPAISLMVYNDNTNGSGGTAVSPGFYYWGGSNWIRVLSGNPASYDLGYILGWTSNVTPPDFMIPISGGTFNWTDYPDFKTFNTTFPSQFIASSNATTFTLKDINNTSQQFLRGSTSAGVTQVQSTALPSTPFTTNTAGDHNHGRGGTGSVGNGNWGLIMQSSGGNNTTNSVDASPGEPNVITSPRELGLSMDGDHTHTINGGGDAETRPMNISTIWCLKVKATGYVGSVTINNGTAVGAVNGLSTYGSAIGLGGTLNQNTTINMAGYNTSFNGTGGLGIGTATIPSESRLVLGAMDANEGGQLQLNAPGGSYTKAFFIDNYQNTMRILSGTNSGTSTVEALMESDGDLRLSNNNSLHMPNNIAYVVDRNERTTNNSNLGFRSIGSSTTSLQVDDGDIIAVSISFQFRWTNGSGTDQPRFGVIATGCGTITQVDTYEFQNSDNVERSETFPISKNYVLTATCTGTLKFNLYMDSNSNADDNAGTSDVVIIATKY